MRFTQTLNLPDSYTSLEHAVDIPASPVGLCGQEPSYPLLCLTADARICLSGIALAITVIGMTVLGFADPGRTSGKGPGIVGFELAGSAAKAILEAWGESGCKVAAFNLGFDYFFIGGYSTFMALMCLWANGRYANPRLAPLGMLLAWLQWIAGLLDCAENAALLTILFRGESDGLALLAHTSALGKFGLLGCGTIYILSSLL